MLIVLLIKHLAQNILRFYYIMFKPYSIVVL